MHNRNQRSVKKVFSIESAKHNLTRERNMEELFEEIMTTIFPNVIKVRSL